MPPINPEMLDLTALKALAAQLAEDVDKLNKEYYEKFRLWVHHPSGSQAFLKADEALKNVERRRKRVHNKQLKVQDVVRDRLFENAHIEADVIVQEFRESIARILSPEPPLGPS